VKLTTHLQLVPRSRKYGSIHPLPHTPLWCSAQLVKHRDNFTLLYWIYASHSSVYEVAVLRISELSLLPASPGYLLGLFFASEDAGNIFLQNNGLPPNYTVLHSSKLLYIMQLVCTLINKQEVLKKTHKAYFPTAQISSHMHLLFFFLLLLLLLYLLVLKSLILRNIFCLCSTFQDICSNFSIITMLVTADIETICHT
jgi:hypothetical protein